MFLFAIGTSGQVHTTYPYSAHVHALSPKVLQSPLTCTKTRATLCETGHIVTMQHPLMHAELQHMKHTV